MKELLRYLGVVVMLVAVLILAIPFLNGSGITNLHLNVSGILLVLGLLSYITINRWVLK